MIRRPSDLLSYCDQLRDAVGRMPGFVGDRGWMPADRPLLLASLASGGGIVLSLAGAPATGAALTAVGTVWLIRRLLSERSRAERAEAHAGCLERSLSNLPQAVALRDDGGRWIASSRFFAALSVDGESGDPAAVLSEAGGSAVREACERLMASGGSFEFDATADDGRVLRVAGWRDERLCALSVDDRSERRAELERMRAVAAAAENDADGLRAAFATLPVLLWLRDRQGRLVRCNEAYARAVDSDPETVVREQHTLLAGGVERELAEKALRSGSATEDRVSAVIGGERRILDIAEVRLPGRRRDYASAGCAIDRTEVEDIRAELRRHLNAHAEVLERLNTAIAIFGSDTRLTFFNHAYARLWKLDEGWLHAEPTHAELMEELRVHRRLPESADFQTFKRERLALYTRLIEPFEELMHLPDGTTLRVMAAPHPLGGLILVQEDVTNTLALESSYNTLMAVQQETLDSLAEGIAVFGEDGRLKLSNPAFAHIWDLRDEDLQGEPHIAHVMERMRPFLTGLAGEDDGWSELKDEMIGATLERSVRSGRLERIDGSVIEFSTLPLPDGAVLNRYLDVTDSTRLQEALLASNAALESADELKSEFISNISHHLRTPLNGIIGFAEVLINQYFGPLNDRQLEYVKGIVNAGGRLLEVIDDIVDLSSVGAGVTGLERSTVQLADIVDTVASLTREWARGEGVRLEVSLAPGLGTIEGDARRLKQALFTLVVAALRVAPRDGRVVLSVGRHDGSVVVTVGDPVPFTGLPGAAYYRNAAADGLGLTLVRNVIELHGGEMEVEGAAGRIARVRCTLPVTATEMTG